MRENNELYNEVKWLFNSIKWEQKISIDVQAGWKLMMESAGYM